MSDAADRLQALLETSGALREGHFQLSSGRHSAAYVQCALLLEEPARAAEVGAMLAQRLRRLRPAAVLSPALGGLIIGYGVAASLGVPFRFCERRAGGMELRRGFRVRPGERTVVVEDVVTTGGSAAEAAALAAAAGADVVALAAIIDRGAPAGLPAPLISLTRLELPSWPAGDCPLCAGGRPLEAPGSRAG